jgi:hypothetical protein
LVIIFSSKTLLVDDKFYLIINKGKNMTISMYLTVTQFCDIHKAFKIGGVRSIIFNEHQNGLAESGAIVRIGRKVLVNQNKFFDWLQSQNSKIGS